jgi:hypothetical protein
MGRPLLVSVTLTVNVIIFPFTTDAGLGVILVVEAFLIVNVAVPELPRHSVPPP